MTCNYSAVSRKENFLSQYTNDTATKELQNPSVTIYGLDLRTRSGAISEQKSVRATSLQMQALIDQYSKAQVLSFANRQASELDFTSLKSSRTPAELKEAIDSTRLQQLAKSFNSATLEIQSAPPALLQPLLAPTLSSTLSASLQTLVSDVPIRSFSSKMMSKVMEFRNTKICSIWSKIWHGTKVAMTEAALPFVTVTAAVETLFYKVKYEGEKLLARARAHFAPQDKQEDLKTQYQKLCAHEPALLSSASFTISWSALTLKDNFTFKDLATHEDVARKIYAITPKAA